MGELYLKTKGNTYKTSVFYWNTFTNKRTLWLDEKCFNNKPQLKGSKIKKPDKEKLIERKKRTSKLSNWLWENNFGIFEKISIFCHFIPSVKVFSTLDKK